MNTGFYKDLDTNFELACKMSEQEFSNEELIELLKNGNIPEKQIAALKLNELKNLEETQILIDNLTGCDGKIREAVALKINQLLNNNDTYISLFVQNKNTSTIFADATIDINGNICRLVIDSVAFLKSDIEFSKKYLERILIFTKEAFEELDKFIYRDKKYVINKQLFKLYWCLEALRLFVDDISIKELLPIIERASLEKEYTIREKVAQIAVLLETEELVSLKARLKQDENYYVREVFKLH